MRSLAQHWKGTKAFAKVVALEAAGKPVLVPQSEAERRATICAGCEKNQQVQRNPLERAEDNIMLKMAGGRTTPHDDKLGTCTACSCYLKTLVHCVPKIILPIDSTKHPKHCWKHHLK